LLCFKQRFVMQYIQNREISYESNLSKHISLGMASKKNFKYDRKKWLFLEFFYSLVGRPQKTSPGSSKRP
ncbi:MAG: hypothetical protein OQL17_12770, partial [Sedimenticola sp.]|nr:hypothetical protein [Sedimenticola sp.]